MVNVSSDSNVEAGDIFSLRYLTYRPLMKPSCPLLMPSRRDATSRCQTSQDMTTLPSCQETALVYFAARLYVNLENLASSRSVANGHQTAWNATSAQAQD